MFWATEKYQPGWNLPGLSLFFLLSKQWHYMKANLIIAVQLKQLGESHLPCQGITSQPSVWKAMSSTARNACFKNVCPSRRTYSYIRKRLNVKDFTLVMILKCFLGKTKGNITSSPGHLSFNSCFFVLAGKLVITWKYSKPQMFAHQ